MCGRGGPAAWSWRRSGGEHLIFSASVSISSIAIRRGVSAPSRRHRRPDQGRSDMGKFVLAYKGGGMAETPEAQEAAMKAWGDWFGTLGSAVVEIGNPFGASTAVNSDGSTGTATAGLDRLLGAPGRQPRARGEAGDGLSGARVRRHRGGLRSHRDVAVRHRSTERRAADLRAGRDAGSRRSSDF